jgi:hypothetical protein
MTVQLKEKIEHLISFYNHGSEHLNKILGERYVKYDELISEQDSQFWQYLCNKDFKRLQKLLSQNLGEGHFLDDSDESDSEAEGTRNVDSEDDDNNLVGL